jgi:hypothetical protein
VDEIRISPSSGTSTGKKFGLEAEFRHRKPSDAIYPLEEAEELAIYPEGSVGHAFRRYRRTPGTLAEKALATRNDWWRG